MPDKILKKEDQKPSGAKKTATKKTSVPKKTTAKTSKSLVTDKKQKTAKITAKKATIKQAIKNTYIEQYYDLPISYGETVVKILAQTPNKLFVYWDISDEDRLSFTSTYGADFFNNSYPVLLVTNTTLNYKFEVNVNDFANSWYLDINDANCKYIVDLGRKPIFLNSEIRKDYIYVAHSNQLDIPNDRILFNSDLSSIEYRNQKTHSSKFQDFSHLKTDSMQNEYNCVNHYYNQSDNKPNNHELYNLYTNLYSINQPELFYQNVNPSS